MFLSQQAPPSIFIKETATSLHTYYKLLEIKRPEKSKIATRTAEDPPLHPASKNLKQVSHPTEKNALQITEHVTIDPTSTQGTKSKAPGSFRRTSICYNPSNSRRPSTRLGVRFPDHQLQLYHSFFNPSSVLISLQDCPTIKQITESIDYICKVT
jgi:hypothetical protein